MSDTIRKIRLSKGLTQEQVAKGYLTQGNYSKFEKGDIEVTASTFIGVMNNLDIGIEEFLYINNGYKYNEKEQIFRDFFSFPIIEVERLESFIVTCERYLERTTDPSISFIHKLCYHLIEIACEKDLLINQHQMKELVEHFMKKEQLYINDLYLINSILYLFPIDTLHLTMDYIEKSLKRYGDYQSIQRLEVNLRLNCSLILIKARKGNEALKQLKIIFPTVVKYKMGIQKAILLIRQGICEAQLGIQSKVDIIEKGRAILHALDEFELLDEMMLEVDMYS